MADLAFYRKYRPSKFTNLVGQPPIQKTLLNAIKSGHLSHAYLFCGPRGTGKTTTARLVAKAINCIAPDPNGESCNKCEYCTLMNQGNCVDLIEIDAASNRGIDEIRDLREKIKFSPNQTPHKVYIIDEVHMLTTPAFNALLKTLEEPPAHAYFVLATTEVHKVPETIISRCQRFDFRRIDEESIIDRLKYIATQEKIKYEDEALTWIAQSAEGGMRDAINLFEQIIEDQKLTTKHVKEILGVSSHDNAKKLFQSLEKQDLKTALAEIQGLHQEGHDLYQFSREFMTYLRRQLLDAIGKPELAKKYIYWIDLFQTATIELKDTLIAQLPLEIAILKACFIEEENKTNWFTTILKGNKEESPTQETKPIIPKKIEENGLQSLPDESNHLHQTPTSKTPPPVLSLNEIKINFQRILEQINTPSVRQSFNTGIITQIQENAIHIEFQSKFHLEKVNTTINKALIENAFEKIFNQKIRLECRQSKMENLVDQTLEIFGGEILD